MVTSGQVASMTRRPRARGRGPDLRRDAVGREDRRGAVGHLVELLHEAHAARLEVAHDVAVVDDLAAHVHRPLEAVEGEVDDLDRAHHARAEAAGGGEEDPLDREGGAVGDHGQPGFYRRSSSPCRVGPRARRAWRRASRVEQGPLQAAGRRSSARPARAAARSPRWRSADPGAGSARSSLLPLGPARPAAGSAGSPARSGPGRSRRWPRDPSRRATASSGRRRSRASSEPASFGSRTTKTPRRMPSSTMPPSMSRQPA